MSAINKTSVPELHRGVCHQLMEMFCFFLGDLDRKASLDSDYSGFSNLATNELLIFLWASRLEILQWSWGTFKLNMHTELCSSLYHPYHPLPFFCEPWFSSLGVNRRPVTGDIQNLPTFCDLFYSFSRFPFLRVWVSLEVALCGGFKSESSENLWLSCLANTVTSATLGVWHQDNASNCFHYIFC